MVPLPPYFTPPTPHPPPPSGGPLLEGEPALAVSDLDVVHIIEVVARSKRGDATVK